MCVCHAFVWRTCGGGLCVLAALPVFAAALPDDVFAGCQGHARGPWGYVCSCWFVRVRRIREPMRTAHEALWQLGSFPSVAAHCSLRQRYYGRPPAATHCDTPASTYTRAHTNARSQVAGSLGAVQPGHSRGHLPFRKGEGSKIWCLNYVQSLASSVAGHSFLCFYFILFFCFFFLLFFVLPSLSSSVYETCCSGEGEIGVKISLASSAHLNQADWMRNTKKCVFLKAGFH